MYTKDQITNVVEALLAKDKGMPYPAVLETYDTSPNVFHRRVNAVLEKPDRFEIDEQHKKSLEEIASDGERKIELFNMGKDFIVEQYARAMKEEQYFFSGTYDHPKNVETLVYHAITQNNPGLKEAVEKKDRKKIIQTIKKMGKSGGLSKYFVSIKLNGLMQSLGGFPLKILRIFDEVYKRKTGNKSLFDLTQKEHLHIWDSYVPRHYWDTQNNVDEAVYHMLTEKHPKLASHKRKEVIKETKNLPASLARHFWTLPGMGRIMTAALRHSPKLILESFDREYQRRTKDKSLFDRCKEYHLSFDSAKCLVR